MTSRSRHFDAGSLVVIVLTFVLFTIALFVKGLTHDLLLEAGVLLVSVKLILLAYKNSVTAETLRATLEQILESQRRLERQGRGPSDGAAAVENPGR